MTRKFVVLHIAEPETVSEYHGKYARDSEQNPDLVALLEDEAGIFVKDRDTGEIIPAHDFFRIFRVDSFDATMTA